MHLVAIVTFYGLLICGLGGGMVFFHQVGRIGVTQALHVMIPMLGVQFSDDDRKRLADIAGPPTSFSDFLLSPTPVGWVKTFGSAIVLLSRYPGIIFSQAIIGGLMGRIWYAVSLPLLALDIALGPALRYWPQWLTASHVTPSNFVLYVIGGYLGAYVLGTQIGSRVHTFNDVRKSFEAIRNSLGDWFDHREDTDHYKHVAKSLQEILNTFDKLLSNELDQNSDSDEARQHAMIIQYERSLVLATLSHYGPALDALKEAQRLRTQLKGYLSYDRDQELESDMLFLEGELLITQRQQERARELFKHSKAIDMARGDATRIELSNKRLAQI